MAVQTSILIVEDDPGIIEILNVCLGDAGYRTLSATSTDAAWSVMDIEKPDLLLLDWMLSGEDGTHFFRQLKANSKFKDLPVIMLTARNTGADQAFVLDQGVEDFIGKPFSQDALLARIRSVLRRTATTSEISHGNLTFNSKKHEISLGKKCVRLFPVESRMLLLLMRRPAHVFTREDLLAQINHGGQVVELRTVDVHVSRLRKDLKKIGMAPLKTIRGVGYMFDPCGTNI